MKKLLIVCIILVILLNLCYIFIISGAFAIFMPKPNEPLIVYGEFPFSVTYQLGDDVFTYEDIIICEYKGIESLGTAGKYRKWSKRLKSGNENILLFKSQNKNAFIEIYIPIPGLPEYYMGDFRWSKDSYENAMKDDRYLGCKQNGKDYYITKEVAWEEYSVKIISVVCSSPIENKFD